MKCRRPVELSLPQAQAHPSPPPLATPPTLQPQSRPTTILPQLRWKSWDSCARQVPINFFLGLSQSVSATSVVYKPVFKQWTTHKCWQQWLWTISKHSWPSTKPYSCPWSSTPTCCGAAHRTSTWTSSIPDPRLSWPNKFSEWISSKLFCFVIWNSWPLLQAGSQGPAGGYQQQQGSAVGSASNAPGYQVLVTPNRTLILWTILSRVRQTSGTVHLLVAINSQATTVAESNFVFFLLQSGSGRRCLIGVLPEVFICSQLIRTRKKGCFSRHCEISFRQLLRM